MKIGERGQVTIPKRLRQRHGLNRKVDVQFVEESGQLVLKKISGGRDPVDALAGSCRAAWRKLGFKSVDAYLDATRGR
jgi:bifunctional DNA-binding transcriptional regulator/antitoxin component of YhaV-PrlF toxin-antitoxin module